MHDTRDTEIDARGTGGGAGDTRSEARDDATARPRGSGTLSERRWSFVAGVCLFAAVALLVVVGIEAAFVAAVLGAVAWLWDQRNRIRANIIEDERSEEGRDALEESDDDDEGERDGDGRRSDLA